jgi:hypothetical protein
VAGSYAHEQRVPVEHRWAGLDRRSIPYAAVALAVLALWAWVMPWVADQVAWDDPIEAGESIQVTDAVTMAAAPGWGVISGLRTSDDTRSGETNTTQTVLAKDGVVLSIVQGPFEESPVRLLDQAELIVGALAGDSGFAVKGEVINRTTASGLRGVAQDFTSSGGVGTITTFVVDDTGIEIQSAGPRAQMAAHADEVAAMIDSLATTDSTDGSGS